MPALVSGSGRPRALLACLPSGVCLAFPSLRGGSWPTPIPSLFLCCPQPAGLLSFLRLSHAYDLDKALALCSEHKPDPLVREIVFLQKRQGNFRYGGPLALLLHAPCSCDLGREDRRRGAALCPRASTCLLPPSTSGVYASMTVLLFSLWLLSFALTLLHPQGCLVPTSGQIRRHR